MSWLRRQSSTLSKVSARRRSGGFARLALEGLEDRTLLDAGVLDPTFGTAGRVLTNFTGPLDSPAGASLRQADGKLVVVGQGSNGTTAALMVARYNLDGSLDTSFDADGRASTDSAFAPTANLLMAVMLQTDGKVLVAALPRSTVGATSLIVARFTTGGARDTSFGPAGRYVREVFASSVTTLGIALQPDTRVLVISRPTFPASSSPNVARFSPDTTLDSTFGSGGSVAPTGGSAGFLMQGLATANLLVQPDGKITVVGLRGAGLNGLGLVRLNADGGVDNSFTSCCSWGIAATHLGSALLPDGRIMAVGAYQENFFVSRYEAFGGLGGGFGFGGFTTTDFGGNDGARSVAAQPDGKIVVAGTTTTFGSGTPVSRFAIARYLPTSQLDVTFGTGGRVTTDFGTDKNDATGIHVQADGKIVVLGTTVSNKASFALARFNDNGTPDAEFGTGGKVITNFTGSLNDAARGVAVQADGKLIVAGTAGSSVAGRGDFALARYLATGALDPAFGTGGRVTTSFDAASQAHAVVVQEDGKIIVAGSAGTNMALARYLTDGTLDPDFDTDGKVTFTFPIGVIGGTAVAYGLALQENDKIVAVGGCGVSRVLARLNPDGSLDDDFGIGGKVGDCTTGGHTALVSARVALQADGKIVTAIALTGSGSGITLRRHNADGSPDTTFAVQGARATTLGIDLGFSGPGLRIQDDGKILVAGSLPTADVTPAFPGVGFGVARYDDDGNPDESFGNRGVVTLDFLGRDSAAELLLDADGQIVVVGPSNELSPAGVYSLIVTRLLPNGRLNTSFGVAGKVAVAVGSTVSPAAHAVLQDDGKLVVVGAAPGTDTANDFLVTRFDLEDTFTTANQRYVGQLYRNLLGRAADAAGFAAFVDLLERATVTPEGLARIISASPEYRIKVVRDLYRTLLGREADAAGTNFFAGFLGTGGTVAQAKATMLGSAEYFQNRTDRTNDGFITSLYRDVLGREPDAGGRAAFRQQLTAGVTRDVVASRVLGSRESLERITQGWYRSYLRRSAEPTGLAAFANFLQAGGREEVALSVLLGSAEFVGGM